MWLALQLTHYVFDTGDANCLVAVYPDKVAPTFFGDEFDGGEQGGSVVLAAFGLPFDIANVGAFEDFYFVVGYDVGGDIRGCLGEDGFDCGLVLLGAQRTIENDDDGFGRKTYGLFLYFALDYPGIEGVGAPERSNAAVAANIECDGLGAEKIVGEIGLDGFCRLGLLEG